MIDRRDFLKLGAVGAGAVFLSGLSGAAESTGAAALEDFYFVQLSDAHWGFRGAANPEAEHTLKRAVSTVNSLKLQPDFIIFTGDLTHTTDDPATRRQRMREFKEIIGGLNVKAMHFLPGEHDASLDHGEAFKELFGPTYYTFEHKGLHCIVLDNVSDPGGRIGDVQLEWLRNDLQSQNNAARIVVFTHRPLFPLVPKWDWTTRDGDQAIGLLMPHPNVTVFYGHIHQEHHHMTGHIAHHAAKSLIFPLPAPGSQEQRTPLPWDPAQPNQGLGFREVQVEPQRAAYAISEYPLGRS